MKTIEIKLDLPPRQRWACLAPHRQEIEETIACYWKDFEDFLPIVNEYLELYKIQYVPKEYLEEMEGIAEYCSFNADQILIANLYYDLVKFAFACTAFAVQTEESIWHARNLDWWTENDILKKYTKVFNFTRGGKTVFQSVGWPGFIGVLSGYKPGAFAITLNAIVSEEAPNLAPSISFLIREVLEKQDDFQSAQQLLEETGIICDCLLLLSGTKRNEMIVIERTPTTSKTRAAKEGCIVVTNDYKLMSYEGEGRNNLLTDTSCNRYDRTLALLSQKTLQNEEDCFTILKDEKVKMKITVQQMVFNSKLGTLQLS